MVKDDRYKIYEEVYEVGVGDLRELRSSVEEFRSDGYERVRLSDIKNQKLNDPKTMSQINKLSQLGQYDSK